MKNKLSRGMKKNLEVQKLFDEAKTPEGTAQVSAEDTLANQDDQKASEETVAQDKRGDFLDMNTRFEDGRASLVSHRGSMRGGVQRKLQSLDTENSIELSVN